MQLIKKTGCDTSHPALFVNGEGELSSTIAHQLSPLFYLSYQTLKTFRFVHG